MKLEVKNIQKSFGKKEVLMGISFTAEGGKAFGLLGRNGAGKTTTIRIIMGVFPSEGGQVLFNAEPIDHSKVGIGYLPEERGLYPKKKIIDQLTYFACLKGMKPKDAVKEIDKWLTRLGMSEYRDKRLDTLSKGNQQKIQLITALVHDPEIVILDEPFSGLDPVNAKLLKDVVKDEIARGKIVLFSSHQMNYIEEFCDSIAIINGGSIALAGELKEIKRVHGEGKIEVRACAEACDSICNQYEMRCHRAENGVVIIDLVDGEEKGKFMSEICQKYDVDCVKVYEPSLNDIFVAYAGEKE